MLYTTEQFKSQMRIKNPDIEILSEYQGDKVKVKCKCKKCGYEWQDTPTHLKLGRGCSQCKKENKRKLLEIDFINRANKIHNNFYDYSKVYYIEQKKKVIITCPIHGDFEQCPLPHLRGEDCPLCGIEKHKRNINRKTLEQFILEANKVHNNLYDYSKVLYINSTTPVIIICKEHGEFKLAPSHHLRGQGCPKCRLKSQTKLYEKLKNSFPNEEILFEVGNNIVSWLDGQRFDIYFPKYNIAVEYNGELHYIPKECFGGQLEFENIQNRDELKRQKCKENNCSLFEIKYNYTEEDYNVLVNNIAKKIRTN